MAFLKLLLGIILGGFLGCVISVLALYPLFLAAAGGRDMNGGIAMGMVTGVAPAGAILGAIGGIAFVLFLENRKNKPQAERTGKPMAIAGYAFLALIAGYVGLFLFLQGPAKISLASNPVIQFEVLLPSDEITTEPIAELYDHRDNSANPVVITMESTGEQTLIKGEFLVDQKAFERALRIRLPNRHLKMTIPLYPGFEMVPGFVEWDGVDYMDNLETGEVELGYSQDKYVYRYQAVPVN